MVRALQSDNDLHPAVQQLPHPAAHLLDHLRCHGAPIVLRTPPWSKVQRDQAMERGSHQSATLHLEFLEQEMLTMVKKGQWLILPYEDVKNLPNLQLSPLGIVPQRDRCPRTIADYTFYGINGDTVPLTDHLPLQFRRALLRILEKIVSSNPHLGPVHIIKIDLADGFYHIHLAPRHIPALGVVFPTEAGRTQLVAFPLALPMGWTSSPLLFCAATETITDLPNVAFAQHHSAPLHCLEAAADTTSVPSMNQLVTAAASTQPTQPLAWANVFINDHIALAQGSMEQLQQV